MEGEPSLLSVNSVDPISAISACVISSFLSKFFSKSRIPRVSIIEQNVSFELALDHRFLLKHHLPNSFADRTHIRIFSSASLSNLAHRPSNSSSSRSLFSLATFPRSSSLILPRDENPRCPPTDTNGHLCQRRNLLLYIPLYKQRVNRAAYELAIGIRAVETDLSIVLRALLLLLLPSRILSLFLRGTSLMCVCIYVCIAYKLEYTRGSVPVPFHQTNFDRSNNDSDCSPLDFSSRSLFFLLLEPGWSLEFLDPRLGDWKTFSWRIQNGECQAYFSLIFRVAGVKGNVRMNCVKIFYLSEKQISTNTISRLILNLRNNLSYFLSISSTLCSSIKMTNITRTILTK